MIIEDGLKLQGTPADIPEASRDDLPGFFKRSGFKIGVEVGVYLGDYTKILAESGLEIYGIDPWQYDSRDWIVDQRKMDSQYQITLEKLKPYPNVHIIKKTSIEALSQFTDKSLDFVYIDANHTFKYIANDIFEWCRKVKVGGILCGHDYVQHKRFPHGGGCHVFEVVNAFVQAYHVPNFWILGRNHIMRPDERRDRDRSWIIIKDEFLP